MAAGSQVEWRSRWPAGLVAAFAGLQIALAFRHNINWDEYYFLSHIHAARAGGLTEPFQTFYVHLLGWIAALPLTEPDQIVAGRLFMILAEMGSLACLYSIARRIAGAGPALTAVATWCAAGYALVHGASFRADPLAAFLLMAALALLFDPKGSLTRAALAGVLAGLGLLVTVKGAFFLPAFAAAFVWASRDRATFGRTAARFAAAGAALAIAGVALWLGHSLSLAAEARDVGSAASSAAVAGGGAFDKVIGSQGLFPRAAYIRAWAAIGPAPVILLLAGAGLAAADFARGRERRSAAVLLLCGMPLLSLALYRNAFPYFFPFLMLPAVLAAVPALAALQRRRVLYAGTLAVMAIGLAAQFAQARPRGQSAQRATAAAVHQLFREPVPYIDRNAMLPSFPHAGFFMSSWGIEAVAAGGRPALAPAIARRQPPLLIANSPVIEAALMPGADWTGPRLLGADARALRQTYIHHWGAIWVAGKSLRRESGAFELAVGGAYTLECEGRRTIDDDVRACGDVALLRPGAHRWQGGPLRLRWGERLPVPTAAPPSEPIYHGF